MGEKVVPFSNDVQFTTLCSNTEAKTRAPEIMPLRVTAFHSREIQHHGDIPISWPSSLCTHLRNVLAPCWGDTAGSYLRSRWGRGCCCWRVMKVVPHTGLLWLFLSQPTGCEDGYGVLRKPWSDSVSAVRDEAELPITTAIGGNSLGRCLFSFWLKHECWQGIHTCTQWDTLRYIETKGVLWSISCVCIRCKPSAIFS